MNEVLNIKSTLNRIKIDSQQLKDKIAFTKQTDTSTGYYLGNLKRLSLQALDVFNAMEKQISFLNNQCRINMVRQNMEKKRRPRRSEDE
jgi:hypothetical protein